MHIVNELVETVTVDDQEYEEIIEEYVEEILVPEGVPEPPMTDIAFDTAPTQGKPWCITLIFYNHRIYKCCAYIYIYTRLRFTGSVTDLPLLIIGDYYYTHGKMMKRKMVTR
jgi:hypothetical protein